MAPLIRVVYDPYSIAEPESGSFVVSTPSEFSHARGIIEDFKAGQFTTVLPWNLIIRQEGFLSGFQDILAWGPNLVTFQDASPRAALERALGFILPTEITNERLISWGIRSEKDLPLSVGMERDVECLLDVALENVSGSQIWSRSAMRNREWLGRWFCYSLTTERDHVHSDDYLMHVIKTRIKQWREAHLDQGSDDLVQLLLEAMSRGSGAQVTRQLMARSLVRSYGGGYTKWLVIKLSSDQVGSWINKRLAPGTQSVLDHWAVQLYAEGHLSVLVAELDKFIGQEMDELNSEEGFERYVKTMSGFFPSEYKNVVRRFCNALVCEYQTGAFDPARYQAYLSLIAERFAPLLANKAVLAEDCQAWMDDLLVLTHTLHELQSGTPATLEQWSRTCISLMRCESLLYAVRKDCPPDLAELITQLEERFTVLNGDLNNSYGDWLLVKFPEYLGCVGDARLVTQATWLAVDGPEIVILLVVDGLRWDWWQSLAHHLAEKGYQIESKDSMGLAMLPTVTNVSRRAALGRFPLLQLMNFVDDVYGIDVDPHEEAMLAARVLGYADQLRNIKPTPSNKKIKYLPERFIYVNGTTEDIRQALRLPARHYVVIYPGIDRATHSEGEEKVLQETILTALRLLAESLADEIDRNSHLDPTALRLIVTADHGCANTRWSKQQSLPAALREYIEQDPHIEHHGRVAQVIVTTEAQQVEAVKQQVKRFYEENTEEWYVIWGDEAAKYGLPQHDKKGREVIAWLSPRNMNYLRRGNGLYVHGGFSLYETIVPLAVLRYSKEKIFLTPTVSIERLDELRKESSSTILVKIRNDNDGELAGVLSVPELGVKRFEIEPVPPHGIASVEVPVTPLVSGEVPLTVTLSYRIGLSEEMEWQKQYTVSIRISRREQMELETRRELF